jgi:WD40 repeat protein/tRNA A-37 threonylcarbamoyl transferase component Bud32/tetratricopeptide (TPR) repeat protein
MSVSLPVSVQLRVEEGCTRFEKAWQAAGPTGAPPLVVEYLGATTGDERAALLRELLLLDVHYRQRRGENPGVEDYAACWPDGAEALGALFVALPVVPASPAGAVPAAEGARATVRPGPAAETGADPNRTAPDEAPVRSDGATSPYPVLPGYEILGELGHGAMGVVYKARQTGLKRSVALKMILSGDRAAAQELTRFRSEAEAVARLQHPNIVQVHEVGEYDGRPFFSLEYVDGGTLATSLRASLPEPKAAAALVEQLARAVYAVHRCDVVHRDLKPANVLLTADGTPKITDFGLAKKLDEDAGRTHPGAIMGTPSYMAPEQASGGAARATPLADVYALGTILYECLTGRPPFRAATVAQTLRQVVEEEPAAPRQLNRAVPRDLETICLKCLQKEPGKRYRSAEELGEELRRFQERKPILARPVSSTERVAKWVRRNPVLAAWMAAAVLVLAAGTATSTGLWIRATDAAVQARRKADDETRARERSEHQLAVNNLLLAQAAWRDSKARNALGLLYEVPEGDRGWEWGYLQRLFNGGHLTLADMRDFGGTRRPGVRRVVFSPDGRRLAAGGRDRMTVWDSCTGQDLFPRGLSDGFRGPFALDRPMLGKTNPMLRETDSGFADLAFSPDSQRLATTAGRSDLYNPVSVWDMRTGQAQPPAPGGLTYGRLASADSVAFSPDGERLAVAGGRGSRMAMPGAPDIGMGDEPRMPGLPGLAMPGEVEVLDARTGRKLLAIRGHRAQITRVVFGPDGQRLATASADRTAKVWDGRTGQELLTLTGHAGAVTSVAFSPEGRYLATGGEDRTARLWDARTGRQILTLFGHAGAVADVAFSPDGVRLATGSVDGTVKVWDARTGQERLTLRGDTGPVTGVAFSPDGQRLATASGDIRGRTVVWDARTGDECLTLRGHTGPVASMAFSPDGQRLVTGSEDKTARVWDARDGRQVLALRGHAGVVSATAFSGDGQRLATGSEDKTARVWDARTGQERLQLQGHAGPVTGVAFSPDGLRLAAACGPTLVWDPGTGREILRMDSGAFGVAFSPDGQRLVTVSESGTRRVWNARTGQELVDLRTIAPPSGGHRGMIPPSTGFGSRALAFSPDGQRLATGSKGWADNPVPGEVMVWHARTGQELLRLTTHGDQVSRVAFSPDGRRLAAGSKDGTVKVWDSHDPFLSERRPDDDDLAFRAGMARLDPYWQEEQAAHAEQAGQWFAAAFHLDRALTGRPEEPALRLRRGRARAEQGQWDAARGDFAFAVKHLPERADAGLGLALTEMALNQTDAYRASCTQTLDRFRATEDPALAALLAWTCSLAPGSTADPERVVQLAGLAVGREPNNYAFARAQGAAFYRAGKFQEAVERFTSAVQRREQPAPSAWLYLALAHGRLHHAAEAKKWLGKARQWVDQAPRQEPGAAADKNALDWHKLPWNERLALTLLQREAEALLQETHKN